MVGGQHYYIEGVMNEFGGDDNFAVAYEVHGSDGYPQDGDPSNLSGNLIGVFVPAPTTLTFTAQPQDATTYLAQRAQFSIAVTTDSVIQPIYQWRKDGVDIPNATGSSYSFVASASDDGSLFDCVARVPGITTQVLPRLLP
jgi:hypothetical protein